MANDHRRILESLGLSAEEQGAYDGTSWFGNGDEVEVRTPIDGSLLATVRTASAEDYERVVTRTREAWEAWRLEPAPRRGEVVREVGNALREHKDDLGRLVSLEMGKILPEGMGEVQEMIDVADLATGLSRTLGGRTMMSERPGHRMYEQWHPLGVVGIISAFNFPVAVWSWNSLIAAVCGDACLWKPSTEVPLTAIAVSRIAGRIMEEHGHPGVFTLVAGRGSVVGDRLTQDRRVDLISATGSVPMGYRVYGNVAGRMGRAILELGGNNGIIVTPNADLDLAERAILFAAVGTAGQRCTSARRVIVHEDVLEPLAARLEAAYGQVPIGDPLKEGTLMGPLVNEKAVRTMMEALDTIRKQGGRVRAGGNLREDLGPTYVEPTIVEAPATMPLLQEEVFAPILYLVPYSGNVDQAIAIQNGVPQGLSSAIFTENLKEAERFLSAVGSDCGIANVNIGTSGAEIGGAFGGEKDTGGGREAGSDAWKQYMRRQTVTVNYSDDLPLAQGIDFDVGDA